ncbi:MAG: stage II sporulation protein M [Oscillospiraceae bacterium]|jgi:hypothetical protein|nr:stage II sporulation protein M [Oscillospiraceae bacterium]
MRGKRARLRRPTGNGRAFSNALPFIKETLRGAMDNRRLLLLWVLLLAGLLAGARLCRLADGFFAQQCHALFAEWLDLRGGRAFWAVLRSSLLSNVIFAIAATLLGLSAAGLPLLGCLPLLRGLGLGVLCGTLYGDFALRGLGGSLLLIVPGSLAAIFGLLLTCKENMDSAQAFGYAAKNKCFPDDWRGLREHLARCAALLTFAICGAVLDGVCAALFGRFLLPNK